MIRRWPFTPRGTGALALALVFLVLAGVLGIGELVYFAVLLAAVTLVSLAALHLARRTETVARDVSPEVPSVGRAAAVGVRVVVRGALPSAAGAWHDGLPRSIRGRAEGAFPAIAANTRGRDRQVGLAYEIVPERRGVQRLGPLTVVVGDPFGLARRARVLGEQTRIVIAPAIVELESLPASAGDSGGRAESTDQLGQGSDNLVARPWAPGDSMRRIHWRATAHRDELMVRQEERESTPEAVVVLDRSGPRWSDGALSAPGVDASFEQAVSACASITARLVADGYAVAVIDSDGDPLTEPLEPDDEAGLARFVEGLATVTARPGDHLGLVSRWFAGGATGPAVIVTGALDETDAASLAPIPGHAALPVLLSADPARGAFARAAEAGWRTGALGPRADLTAVWSRIAAAETVDA